MGLRTTLQQDVDMSQYDAELEPLYGDVEDVGSPAPAPQRTRSLQRQPLTYGESFKHAGLLAWRRLTGLIPATSHGSALAFTSLSSRLRSHSKARSARGTTSRVIRSCLKFAVAAWALALVFLALFAILSPSYTHPPRHYEELRLQAQSSRNSGRINVREQKVFLAASLYDPKGDIVSGAWGRSVLQLIDLLGPNNTFLSIYESDSGPRGAAALGQFEEKVECDHKLVSEETLDWTDPARIKLPDGELAIKRIAYLAATRNRALDPLENSGIKYDRILYLNDVIFDPIEASQLLFSTNLQEDGRPKYIATCAVDFISPFKFYDRFAARDLEGYYPGLPLYPWFSSAGRADSRRDVLEQKDAVRVKSCWGGMVAFDARYFQRQTVATFANNTEEHLPVRFRSEPDLYSESSECCLVHADLQAIASSRDEPESGTGIYMNPYIRTAYTERTFRWLNTVRMVEKLLTPLQSIINKLVGLPTVNERRTEKPGQAISKTVWVQNTTSGAGKWEKVTLPAKPGGFCAVGNLQVRRLNLVEGAKNWETIRLQDVPSLFALQRSSVFRVV